MRKSSFMITSLIFASLAVAVACDANRRVRESEAADTHESRVKLAQEGDTKLAQAAAIRADLEKNHGLVINTNPKVPKAQVAAAADKFDWNLDVSVRREIQGKIALYLQLINRVLEIDSKRFMTITDREIVLAGRDSAELIQKSVEKFEKVNGENFKPKADSRRADRLTHEDHSG